MNYKTLWCKNESKEKERWFLVPCGRMKKINKVVFELYGLSEEERRIIV
jgi:hypothetical protein